MGTGTYYEDRGLPLYATYQYRITVYNDIGYTNSEPSEEVTTFGGIPTEAATVEAYSINHTAIEVRWIEPCEWCIVRTDDEDDDVDDEDDDDEFM